jgi:hypothetical protein
VRLKQGSREAEQTGVASVWSSSSVTAYPRRRANDAGAILVSTLTKVLLVLAVIGTIGYDSLSIFTTQYRVRDDAVQAALAGNIALHTTGSPAAARAAVIRYAAQNGDVIVRQGPAPDRKNGWYVELRREARTIVASYVPRAKDSIVATASSTASDPL